MATFHTYKYDWLRPPIWEFYVISPPFPALHNTGVFTTLPFEIRLLTLKKGGNDDELVYTLESYSLQFGGDYEALSYVWGSDEKNQTIMCSGKVLKITQNLHNCLRHLRYKEGDRVLWIDAICLYYY